MINGTNFKLILDKPKREVETKEDKAKSGGWGNEFPPAVKTKYLKLITKINVKNNWYFKLLLKNFFKK